MPENSALFRSQSSSAGGQGRAGRQDPPTPSGSPVLTVSNSAPLLQLSDLNELNEARAMEGWGEGKGRKKKEKRKMKKPRKPTSRHSCSLGLPERWETAAAQLDPDQPPGLLLLARLQLLCLPPCTSASSLPLLLLLGWAWPPACPEPGAGTAGLRAILEAAVPVGVLAPKRAQEAAAVPWAVLCNDSQTSMSH